MHPRPRRRKMKKRILIEKGSKKESNLAVNYGLKKRDREGWRGKSDWLTTLNSYNSWFRLLKDKHQECIGAKSCGGTSTLLCSTSIKLSGHIRKYSSLTRAIWKFPYYWKERGWVEWTGEDSERIRRTSFIYSNIHHSSPADKFSQFKWGRRSPFAII